MVTRQQRSIRLVVCSVAITLCSLTASAACAQDQQTSGFVWGVTRSVLFDPTTYVPSAIAYDSTVRDWKTSQPLFRVGFLEHNPRFTVSGLPNDIPVSYSEGNRRIISDAVTNLELSLVNNFTGRIVERTLIERYPEHQRLIKTLGWVERIGVGTYLSYVLSVEHYRQANVNSD